MSNALRVLLSTLSVSLVLAGCGNPTPAPDSPTATSPTSATPVAEALASGDPCQIAGQTYCVLNPQVTPATISQTICVKGWATRQRKYAETHRTNFAAEKRDALAQLHAMRPDPHPNWNGGNTEWDHRGPIEGGFSVTDLKNLSLQFADAPTPSNSFRNHKDDAEDQLNRRVCPPSNQPLRQAQTEFVAKWLAPYPAYKGGA